MENLHNLTIVAKRRNETQTEKKWSSIKLISTLLWKKILTYFQNVRHRREANRIIT
jgi:hypothetical protein